MKNALKLLRVLVLLCILTPMISYAQYFDLGAAPHSIKWKQIEKNGNKYIFDKDNLIQATTYMNYMDTLRPYIYFGFSHAPNTFPVLMQPQNLMSNGLMMYAPKRMEINLPPDIETYSEPWLKHLAAHEYRHSVQFANVNQNFIKGLGYVIGDQSVLLGAALLSMWFMEGDAVLSETQFSEYGRGLQPSFSIEYRAAIDQMLAAPTRKIDRWFCGSYRDDTPNHYQLGYQLVNYSYTRYGKEFWDKPVAYVSKYPYTIFPMDIALKIYFDTSSDKLFRDAFADLNELWKTQAKTENSSDLLPGNTDSFTTYNNPMPENDSTLVALKTSVKRVSAITEVNTLTGEEQKLAHTGIVSTKPSMDSQGRILWTEYRSSTFWEQRINSKICYIDPAQSNRIRTVKKERQALFPVGLEGGELAYLKYHYKGNYSVELLGAKTTIKEFDTNLSLHGLTYDALTDKFYLIALDNRGMSIISLTHSGEVRTIKSSAFVTLSSLRSSGGKLYFKSISSGIDEAHMIDLSTNREYQLTESRYGSFDPMASEDGQTIYSTQYSTKGYLLASQPLDTSRLVSWQRIPHNKINPERLDWNLPKIDSVVVDTSGTKKLKSYSKMAHLFNLHSWAPLAYNPKTLLSETDININVGATIMSQNILNSTTAYLSYAWTSLGSTISGGIDYVGLAPKFSVDATYSTSGRYLFRYADGKDYYVPSGMSDDLFTITASCYLPIYLSSGYITRLLQPSLGFYHDNMLYQELSGEMSQLRQKVGATLQYITQTRMATMDLQPRWGYALRASYVSNPFCDDFSSIYSAYARAYLPGVVVNHGITLQANYQYQDVKYWCYQQKELFPRGADYNFAPKEYYAASVDYLLPLCYPEGGICSIVYFKRISLELGYDFARYKAVNGDGSFKNLTSYGAELLLDINLLQVPAMATTQLGIWVFKPSDSKGVSWGINFSVPL